MQGLTAVGGRKAEFHPSLMCRLGLPLLAMSSALSVPAAHAGSWISTATQAMPPQNISQPTALPASTPLRITVALKVQNKPQLDQLALAVNTPGNAQYGHFLTPAQFEQSYSPSTAQAQAVVEYLQQSGFSNIQVSPNRLAISAQGPASAAEAAFNTPLVQFLNAGKTVYANTSVAQVPSSLNGIVASVIGLQSTGRMQTQIVHQGSSSAKVPASAAVHTASTGLPQIIPEFTASMTRVAYDADAAPTGLGTSVAVLTWGNVSQVPADLLAYEKLNSLPQVPFKNIVVGSPSTSTSGLDEWDLDSQASSGIATNLRQILMYSVYDGDDADLAMGVHQIVSDDLVKAVNMSFGGCEEINFLDGSLVSMDQGFEQGAVEGITFFAAAGDGGASCQLIANAGQPGVLGAVEYPGSSNWVVTSGGTSLFINADGSYDTEISWISGGGGVSLFEFAQGWQQPVLPPLNTAVGLADPDLGLGFPSRGVPDVAMNGDDLLSPTVIVVKGSTEAVGGTSVSSPLSMGAFARFQAAHGECYGFAAPLYYAYVPLTGAVAGVLEEIDAAIGSVEAIALGAAPLVPLEPGLGQAATGFHDITVGFNFLYPATPGWDYTTGLGSFDVAAVNAELPAISCAPEAPFKLTAGVANGQVQLSWGVSPAASTYAVYAGTAPGAESPSPVASGSTSSGVVSGLAGTHYFTVQAANAKGSSPSSNEVEVSIPVVVPAALKVTGSTASSVSLSWGASGNASDYYVYEGTTSGGESGAGIYSGGTSVTIGGLKSGTKYYFTVKAYNHPAALSSAASNEVSVTTAP